MIPREMSMNEKVIIIIMLGAMLALIMLILYSALIVASREDEKMSVSKWRYDPEKCTGFCCGDCDLCHEWEKWEESDEDET